MQSPKRSNGERVPCDFCGDQIAVLYCRADSAKLCLFCDQQVHSANALSRKHIRSQICDNCSSEPVSVRCCTDNLVLCQDCDWDAHGSCSVSAAHDRNPVEGFSGCPSAAELSAIWGFDINEEEEKKPPTPPSVAVDSWVNNYQPNAFTFQDLMVPNDGAAAAALSEKQSPGCGKHKLVIFKQLVELFRRDLLVGNGGGGDGDGDEDDGCAAACGGGGGGDENFVPGWQGNVGESLGIENGGGVLDVDHQALEQQTPFTSLLMLQSRPPAGGEIFWDDNPTEPSSQVLSQTPFQLHFH